MLAGLQDRLESRGIAGQRGSHQVLNDRYERTKAPEVAEEEKVAQRPSELDSTINEADLNVEK